MTMSQHEQAQVPFGACAFDHDGCVVCSDAGILVRVIALDGDDALCEDAAGNRAQIAVELVAPVRVGDTLLAHGGVAISHVTGLGMTRHRSARGLPCDRSRRLREKRILKR
jgi:hypothetical protein